MSNIAMLTDDYIKKDEAYEFVLENFRDDLLNDLNDDFIQSCQETVDLINEAFDN